MKLSKHFRRTSDSPSVSTPSLIASIGNSHPEVAPEMEHPAVTATAKVPTSGVTSDEDYRTTITLTGALSVPPKARQFLIIERLVSNLLLETPYL